MVLAVGVRQGVVDLNDHGPVAGARGRGFVQVDEPIAAAASPRFALSKSARMLASIRVTVRFRSPSRNILTFEVSVARTNSAKSSRALAPRRCK